MARKCAKCGVVSEIEEAFQKSDSSDEIFYCPACSKDKSIRFGESFLLAFPILLIAGIVWVMVNPRNEFAWLVFQAGLFICLYPLTVAFHELGHVVAGFLTKSTIHDVTVGIGHILFKFELCGVEWRFCKVPVGGFTYVAVGDKKFYRIRNIITTLGGPLMNCLLVIVLAIALSCVSSPWLSAIIKAFMASNIFACFHALVPKNRKYSGRNVPSDGLALLTEPFMSGSQIDKEIEAYYAWQGYYHGIKGRIEDAKRSYEKGLTLFPDSMELQIGMSRNLMQSGNYADARTMLVQLQKNTDLKSAMAISLLNDIATADVMMGTEQLLDEADVFSKTACEKMPWQMEFKGTRGLVLTKKGRIEQGLALLKEAMNKTEIPSHKAWYASYIAEFESKKDNKV
jgi:hypothetical protein